ncbi:10810_t:CDS:2 [Funneliformis mosseae]|uniref:10810_t:CDS:1 n=1 Tax=Funneliformis mosseae TaxID=27381 RepID=A0A9N8ZIV2_FUNMO|nr:10810_t:CDS:2 [Funneliformis mosseae]
MITCRKIAVLFLLCGRNVKVCPSNTSLSSIGSSNTLSSLIIDCVKCLLSNDLINNQDIEVSVGKILIDEDVNVLFAFISSSDQQLALFHLTTTLPVRSVCLTTASVHLTAVQACLITASVYLIVTQACLITAQAFYSTTMLTRQIEELTKQKYPNIRVPRLINSYDKCLEGQVRQFEEDNNVLQTFNDKFGNENDKLMIESNELKAELIRYHQYRVVRNIPSLIIDKRSASPNETNAEKARIEMKNLMKGQISAEYQLDYEKTFSEQSTTIYKKLILKLKRLMNRVFNPSIGALEKVNRRLYMNT